MCAGAVVPRAVRVDRPAVAARYRKKPRSRAVIPPCGVDEHELGAYNFFGPKGKGRSAEGRSTFILTRSSTIESRYEMLFTVQVFKNLVASPDREWTNVYHVEAPNLAAAVTAAAPIPVAEISVHQSVVNVSRMRISTSVEFDSIYEIVPIDSLGAGAGSDFLPLFNCVRVDVHTASPGRPDRKYYRPPIEEGGQTNFVLTTATQNAFQSMVNNLISTMNTSSPVLVSNQGDAWVSATCIAPVQMRQLHRKRRKKLTS